MNTLKIKSINDIKISKVKLNENDNNKEIIGYDYFTEPYCNIFLYAKKKSGKTTLIYNILKHTGLKNHTKIIIICSTINKDATYEKIMDYCNKNYVDCQYYDDINIDGENVINNFIQMEKQGSNKKEQQKEQKDNLLGNGLTNFIKFTSINKIPENNITTNDDNNDNDDINNDIKKTNKIYPEYIIVIDDLGVETRNKYITQLLKTNRHYKSKVILSSQNLEDLQPAAIRNLDYVLLFGGIPEEKILKIREQIMLDIDRDKLLEIYKIITSKKYNFLYIDIRNEILRENFNKLIEY
jgi:hypothetical protein